MIHPGGAAGAGASAGSTPAEARALVVGLGGGALPMCLARYLPALRLTTCDIDPAGTLY